MKKSMFLMSLEERKFELISRLFIDPADSDYVAARWAYENGLFAQFYWGAAQAFEKYLKATLLLNDCSSIGYGHDIEKLCKAVLELDSDNVLPSHVRIPNTTGLGAEWWTNRPYSDFLKHIALFGSTDNRYGSVGTSIGGPLIHFLDEYVCKIRCLFKQKNFFRRDLYEVNSDPYFFFDVLIVPDRWMIGRDYMLERLYLKKYRVGESVNLRRAFSNMNLSFFRQSEEPESTFGGLHLTSSPLHNHLVRIADPNDPIRERMSEEEFACNQQIVPELRKWVDDNIYIGKPLRAELNFK